MVVSRVPDDAAGPHDEYTPARGKSCGRQLGAVATASPRFAALDGLRGWAAAAVVVFHAILHFNPALAVSALEPPYAVAFSPTFPNSARFLLDKIVLTLFSGEAAVMIFFVLSGFVLQRSLLRQTRIGWTIAGDFVLRRACRLMPAVMASVLAIYLGQLLQAAVLKGPPPPLAAVWRNMLLIDTVFHGVTWTLRVEMLIIPFILVVAWATQRFGALAAGLAVAYGAAAIQNPELTLHATQLHIAALPFALGMFFALPAFASIFNSAGTGVALVCLGAFVYFRGNWYAAALAPHVAQMLLAGLVVASVAYARNGLTAFLEGRVSQFLGKISYSLYLFAPAVGSVLLFYQPIDAPIPPAWATPVGLVVSCVVLALTIPVALASERWIEQPGIELGRRLSRKLWRN